MQDDFVILVSDDRTAARLAWTVEHASGARWPDAAALRTACEQKQLALSDALQERIIAIARGAAAPEGDASNFGGPSGHAAFTLASATSPVEAQDGRFEWSAELRPPAKTDRDGRIDPFQLDAIVTVVDGTVIGRLIPPQDGAAGTDVLGHPIQPKRPKGQPVALGGGLRSADDADGVQVVATRAGRVVEAPLRLSISEVLQVSGDVDFESGSIRSLVDVEVRGAIRAKFHVHTQGALTVGGAVEAADVHAGGPIVIRGGVFGAGRTGRVQTDHSIRATLFNEAVVVAGGGIAFDREILNSDVRTNDRVMSDAGTIIGGQVYARNGMSVGAAGSEAGVATELAMGYELSVLREVDRLERAIQDRNKSAEEIRRLVAPLLQDLKRLTPTQRERATELMGRVSEIEDSVTEFERKRAALLSDHAPDGHPAVIVREAVYPGVHVRISRQVAPIRRMLPGPLRIEVRKVDEVSEIVSVNARTGSVTILPSNDVNLDPAPPLKPSRAST